MKERSKLLGSAILIVAMFLMMAGCGSHNSNVILLDKTESAAESVDDMVQESEEREESDTIRKSSSDIQNRIRECIAQKKYPQAIFLLEQTECDETMQKTLLDLRYLVSEKYIANMGESVAAIDEEGKVKVSINAEIYPESYLAEVSEWENMSTIYATGEELDGIDANGNFLTTTGDYGACQDRNQNISDIGGISTLSAGNDCFAALDRKGELHIYFGSNDLVSGYHDRIAEWEDVVDVVAGPLHCAVLFRDGTVDYIYMNEMLNESGDKYNKIYQSMKDWTEIVDIEGAVYESIAGLRADGTVVVTDPVEQGYYDSYQYDVSEWTDIIAISKSYKTLLGLKRDGTVVLAGPNNQLKEQVESWRDIVAVAAGDNFHIGLKSDGTMVIAGEDSRAETLPDLTNMDHLLVPTVE